MEDHGSALQVWAALSKLVEAVADMRCKECSVVMRYPDRPCPVCRDLHDAVQQALYALNG